MNHEYVAQTQIVGAGYQGQAVAEKMKAAEYQRGQINGQTARDRSPIEQAMDEIDQAIESLTYELNELNTRMIPVMRPETKALAGGTNGNVKPAIACPSPVEERLSSLAQRVRNLAQMTNTTRGALAI